MPYTDAPRRAEISLLKTHYYTGCQRLWADSLRSHLWFGISDSEFSFMQAQNRLIEQLDTLPPSAMQGFLRLRTPIDVTSLIGWLKVQTTLPKIYWHTRERDREFAVIGCIREITDIEALSSLTGHDLPLGGSFPRYYGGIAFDPTQPVSEEWQSFGPCRFILPRIELIRQGNETELVCNLWFDEKPHEQEIAQARNALIALASEVVCEPPKPFNEPTHTPNETTWKHWITQVTQPGSLQRVPKVVLSRRSDFALSEQTSPWDQLAHWQSAMPACFHFGYQFESTHCFIASSPERLYRRDGRQLFSEALAGSTPRTGDATQDAELAELLMHDQKNRLENRFVHTDILTRLDGLAETATVYDLQVLPLKHIQHMKRAIEATLQSTTQDWQLLQKLHPTPAVGGSPRRKAMALIRTLETHARGWYAGACGFISEDVSEFAVAIRSGLWQSDTLSLYTGAGILQGSDAHEEWLELNTKLRSITGQTHE